jgi:hypothetical protein
MTDKQRDELWTAIHAYVTACGVAVPTRKSAKRETARLAIEHSVLCIEHEAQRPRAHPDAVGGFQPGPDTDPWDL